MTMAQGSLLPTRRLGSSDVHVSILGFGCGPLGNLMRPMTNGDASDTVAAALAAGMRYFDTAPFYGAGLSERRLGLALSSTTEPVVVSSKVGRLLVPGGPAHGRTGPFVACPPMTPAFDYSRDGAYRSIEDSLQRLGRDRIDVALIHDVSPRMHGEALEIRFREAVTGALPALVRLREQGVVGAIGLGVSDWQICMRFAEEASLDVFLLACSYTLLDQEPLRQFLPFCLARRISVIAAAPFVSGILASGTTQGHPNYFYADAPPDVVERVRRLEAVGDRHGVALPAAALQLPLSHPAVASVLPGFRTPEEVRANLSHVTASIPDRYWDELKAEGLIDRDTPVP